MAQMAMFAASLFNPTLLQALLRKPALSFFSIYTVFNTHFSIEIFFLLEKVFFEKMFSQSFFITD